VELVNAPVLNEPVVPEPPPAEEVHEVLLFDVQFILVLVLYAIEDDEAETETEGAVAGATVTVVLWLADPPTPVQVTVYVVELASAPVLNEPVVPDPPPAEEVHEVLLADDQVMVVLALFRIEYDPAETDTMGMAVEPVLLLAGGALLSSAAPLPHAESTRLNTITVANLMILIKLNDCMTTPSVLL
jgi:hypothetical protein